MTLHSSLKRAAGAAFLAFGMALLVPSLAAAQPTKPLRIIVGFPPGGTPDVVARNIADQLGKELGGEKVIVENKPGANGALAALAVASADPDGTALWISSVGASAIAPALYPKLSYDMLKDFAPVSRVMTTVEAMVVSPQHPAKNAAEFVDFARKDEKLATIASPGNGSLPHLVMEQFADASKTRLLHVPYKGSGQAFSDVIDGRVGAYFVDLPGVLTLVRGGKLKALAIAGDRRHPSLPDVPALAEHGMPGVDSANWYALFTTAGTPPARVNALNDAVRKTLAMKSIADKLSAMGADPHPSTPQELGDLVRRDIQKWSDLIRRKGIRAE
jgi:tripartite-type tricarboxylate transporter receptor subunit TctC